MGPQNVGPRAIARFAPPLKPALAINLSRYYAAVMLLLCCHYAAIMLLLLEEQHNILLKLIAA